MEACGVAPGIEGVDRHRAAKRLNQKVTGRKGRNLGVVRCVTVDYYWKNA
jgi:hypothetical protein